MTPSTDLLERPEAAGRPRAVRRAAAHRFRRRVALTDRIARALISVSGIGIICAILGIALFLFLEVLPLLLGTTVEPGAPPQEALGPETPARLVLVDEHQEKVLVLGAEPVIRVRSLRSGGAAGLLALEGLEDQRIGAVSRNLRDPIVALGTDQGRVWVGTVAFQTAFEGAERRIQPVLEGETILDVAPGRPIHLLAHRWGETQGLVAAVADSGLVLARVAIQRPLIGPATYAVGTVEAPLDRIGRPTALLLNEPMDRLLIGTRQGELGVWDLGDRGAPQLREVVSVVPGGSVTALSYLLGDRSIAVGGSDGSVATWSFVPDETAPGGRRLAPVHPFPPHDGAVSVIAPSSRDKGFVTASRDGLIRLSYMTTERMLSTWRTPRPAQVMEFAPKANGVVLVDAGGTLRHWRVHNPHPNVSWRALFGRVQYEGYAEPRYIWQSHGGTDDFEPKFSLVPLAFGTLKGTFYALLFSVPLAVLGALYTSQFLDKRIRGPVKSTVELMAALPSVVLGFVAGLVLAPLVQARIVPVLVLPVILPLVATFGMWATASLPGAKVRALVKQHEFWLLFAWLAVGAALALALGPWAEGALFGGEFEAWLLQTTGIRYDQRNALVIGWAMGFAVIPIIFTICEDAFSSVPGHLVGASLACGATPWQTALKVVLPAGGSGVFSAIMVGFGRAVGETMIVLMATGNTPVMDWTIFNGFRALSANIAVEIPEAPFGSTHYRVLFVAALLLFGLTFLVNTVAELIRLRLRRRLRGL